jgi:hypothetical protein
VTYKDSTIETTAYNPFHPPESMFGDVGLAADIEFLVSDECILCEDKIALPKICIQSGQKADLVARSATLKCCPGIFGLLIPLIFFLGPVLVELACKIAGLQPLRPPSPLFITLVLLAVFGWLAWRFTKRIEVTWFIRTREAVAEEKRIRKWRGWLIVAGLVLVAVVFLALTVDSDFIALAFFPVIAGALFWNWSGHSTKPVFAGKHDGLNILKGLSSEFLHEVQSLIERHHSETA